jgi:hypothetical protein
VNIAATQATGISKTNIVSATETANSYGFSPMDFTYIRL